MKTLTIGMPVFNDALFLEESLKSILNQTHRDFTLILSDDCSTDGSAEICKRFGETDLRVQYIRQPVHLGISRNMKFLLDQAKTKYFLWAADDDLWASTFVEKLIEALESNRDAVAAFCTFCKVDERGNIVVPGRDFDFSQNSRVLRLRKFIAFSDDTFGYGLFLREAIKEVEFPEWWWPNRESPFNNIFPSLCFYLTKGDYVHVYGEPLFYKRVKNQENRNYKRPYGNDRVKIYLAYCMRRFNLAIVSWNMIAKAGGRAFSFPFLPLLLYHWFAVSCVKQGLAYFRKEA